MKVSQGLKSFYSTSQLRRYLPQFRPLCCGEKANYKNETSKRKKEQNDSFANAYNVTFNITTFSLMAFNFRRKNARKNRQISKDLNSK